MDGKSCGNRRMFSQILKQFPKIFKTLGVAIYTFFSIIFFKVYKVILYILICTLYANERQLVKDSILFLHQKQDFDDKLPNEEHSSIGWAYE